MTFIEIETPIQSLVNIIPKISTPLSAICFIFLIIYLLKRSDDRKKEKALEAPDPETQRKAVELILRDIEDIQINPIDDPVESAILAKQVIEGRLKTTHKKINALLILCGISSGTFLLYLMITNTKASPKPIFPDPVPPKYISWADSAAMNKQLPYAILSVVQHIKFSDVVSPDKINSRRAEFRVYYTIKAIRKISKSDPVFLEQFLSNVVKVKDWAGSENQKIESVHSSRYYLHFEMEKDEIKTLVTGADYLYPIPLKPSQGTDCFGDVCKSINEWMTCYPNDRDYIDNLTVLLEADNFDINLPPKAVYKKDTLGKVINDEEGICRSYESYNKCTITGTWKKISPGECCGLKIKWELPKRN